MKIIKDAALMAACLLTATMTAGIAQAGYGTYGYQGGNSHHGYYKYGWYSNHYAKIPAGATIKLPGYFGDKPGHAFLFVAGAKYHVKVLAWTPKGMKLQMPFMKLAEAAPGKLLVLGTNGYVYGSFPVFVLPPVKKPIAPPQKAEGAPKKLGAPERLGDAPVNPQGQGAPGAVPQQQIIVEPPADKAPTQGGGEPAPKSEAGGDPAKM